MNSNAPSIPCSSSASCDHEVFASWVATLVARHRMRLMALMRRAGLAGDDGFDAVQDAFQAFLRLPQARALAGDAEASGRMLTALARNAARARRRRVRVDAARANGDVGVEALVDPGVGADSQLARAEESHALRVCLRGLSEVQRAVVALRMLDEAPGEEVATALGISPQHVAVLLYRAKASLRGCMAAAGYCGSNEGESK